MFIDRKLPMMPASRPAVEAVSTQSFLLRRAEPVLRAVELLVCRTSRQAYCRLRVRRSKEAMAIRAERDPPLHRSRCELHALYRAGREPAKYTLSLLRLRTRREGPALHPLVRQRSGRAGRLCSLGQWFPALLVLLKSIGGRFAA